MKLNKTINEYMKGTTIRREEFDYEKNERESHYIAGQIIGKEQGKKQGLLETAKNLLEMGCATIEQISKATGLSVKEVEKLSLN